jgi:hypothetical protein
MCSISLIRSASRIGISNERILAAVAVQLPSDFESDQAMAKGYGTLRPAQSRILPRRQAQVHPTPPHLDRVFHGLGVPSISAAACQPTTGLGLELLAPNGVLSFSVRSDRLHCSPILNRCLWRQHVEHEGCGLLPVGACVSS